MRQVGGADGVRVSEHGGAVMHNAMTKFMCQRHSRAAIAPKSFLMNAVFDGNDDCFCRKLCFAVSVAHELVVYNVVDELFATASSENFPRLQAADNVYRATFFGLVEFFGA